jgi:hypothetical protein
MQKVQKVQFGIGGGHLGFGKARIGSEHLLIGLKAGRAGRGSQL